VLLPLWPGGLVALAAFESYDSLRTVHGYNASFKFNLGRTFLSLSHYCTFDGHQAYRKVRPVNFAIMLTSDQQEQLSAIQAVREPMQLVDC
jgi:hypothetical protein